HVEVIGSQVLRAADIARHLGLARTAPLLRVQLIGRAENKTMNVSEHYFNHARFSDLPEKLTASRSLSKAYVQFGISDYTRKWSRITATLPEADVARLLGQPKNRPILQVEALNVDAQGAPLQYSLTRFAGDWVQLTVSDDG
ncbi:MAG: UTRA domain-containing protein, partial [Achromobacter sp.]